MSASGLFQEALTYETFAAGTDDPEGQLITWDYSLNPGDLLEGDNVIAIELHNIAVGSSDIGIDLQLVGSKIDGADSFISLTSTGSIKSRARSMSGESSALREIDFRAHPATSNLARFWGYPP